MLPSQCSVCGNKKVGLFQRKKDLAFYQVQELELHYEMNHIINKFILAGDRFMPEMHLRDPIVGTYSACGPFTKNKQRIQKFMETDELDKACFQDDMAYGDFKDLKRRTQSDKFLKDKAFEIASNPKYDGYQRGLDSMVYRFLT